MSFGQIKYTNALSPNVPWSNLVPDNSRILFYDSGGNNWSGMGVDMGGHWWLRTGTDSQNVMTMLENGNVGIGTTDPQGKLEIDSGSNFRTLRLKASGTVGPHVDFLNDTTFSSFITYLNSSQGSVRGNALELNNTNPGGRINFSINDVANPQMTVKSDGNVGIGTTNPLSILHVKGTSEVKQIYETDGTDGNRAEIHFLEPGSSGMIARYDGVQNTFHFIPLITGTEQLPALTIVRNDGNVGIGTNNPASKLDVSAPPGQETFNRDKLLNSSPVESQIIVRAGPNNQFHGRFYIGSYYGAGGIFSAIQSSFINNSQDSFNNLALNPRGGNVGIGTTSPNYKLDVVGDVNITGNFLVNGVSNSDYTARAWVVFSGSGIAGRPSVTIKKSVNVMSVVRLAQGSYQINFTTSMPSEDYAVVSGAGYNSSIVRPVYVNRRHSVTASSFSVYIGSAYATGISDVNFDPDPSPVSLVVFA